MLSAVKGTSMRCKHIFCSLLLTLTLPGTLGFCVEARAAPLIEGLDARIETLKEEGHFPGVALAVMRKG